MKRSVAVCAIAVFFLSLLSPSLKVYAYEWNGIRLMPYGGVSEIYDDNILFSKNDVQNDFITSLNTGLLAHFQSHLTTFELAGGIRYEIFSHHHKESNLAGNLSGDWKQEMSKYDRFHVHDEYEHTNEPSNFIEAFNKGGGRYTYQDNLISVGYEHDFTSQLSAEARYANEITTFATPLYFDSYMNTVGGGVLYHLSSITDFTFDYDFTNRDFASNVSATDHTIALGVHHYLTKQLSAGAKVGGDFIDGYDNKDYNAPRFQATLADDINPTTTLSATYEKEDSLNPYNADVFKHWQITSTLDKKFTKRLKSLLSAFYGDGEYAVDDTRDRFFGVDASLTYDLTRNWQGTARYTFINVTSNDPTQGYRRNAFILSATYNF